MILEIAPPCRDAHAMADGDGLRAHAHLRGRLRGSPRNRTFSPKDSDSGQTAVLSQKKLHIFVFLYVVQRHPPLPKTSQPPKYHHHQLILIVFLFILLELILILIVFVFVLLADTNTNTNSIPIHTVGADTNTNSNSIPIRSVG